MKPGETDCSACIRRPVSTGGSGACPMRGILLEAYQQRKYPCPKFREGDFRKQVSRHDAQQEGLF